MLSATGTASSTTFLRGDNTWVVPTDTNTNQLTTFTVSATTDTVDSLMKLDLAAGVDVDIKL